MTFREANDVEMQIRRSLAAAANMPLRDGVTQLLRVMGYRSDRLVDLQGVTHLLDWGTLTDRQRSLFELWSNVCGLFQFTADEIPHTDRRLLRGTPTEPQSVLFLAADLTPWEPCRRVLKQMTQAVNRIFAMPVVVVYRYRRLTRDVPLLAVAVVHRRVHKRDSSKDVLEWGALVSDVRTRHTNPAHVELLARLKLDRLIRVRDVRRVAQLHLAWESILQGFRAVESLDPYLLYLRDLDRYPLIGDPQRERRIAHRAREGDRRAAALLVTANLPFVIWRLKEKEYWHPELEFPELVCIGNEGLLKAVKRFDPDRRRKFITYARSWIDQTVRQALAEQGRPVRIPLNRHPTLVRLLQTQTTFEKEHGRRPTGWEIAEEMDEPLQTVRALRWASADVVRLDAPVDGADLDRGSIGEWLLVKEGADIEEDFEDRARLEFLERVFARHLTERERKILVLYYGLDDGADMTLEQIGELLGVTRERIRQIRNRAFAKLRASPDGEALEGFWRGYG